MNLKICVFLSRLMFVLLLMLFSSQLLLAQTIQLIDKSSHEPIMGATFQYGYQTGISSDSGMIQVKYEPNQTIYFSHLTYGNWQMDDEKFTEILSKGILECAAQTVALYPVTIIALHAPTIETNRFDFDYNDKMSHDGGQVLSQSPAISGIRKSGNYGFDPVLRGFKYDQLNIVLNGAQSAIAACPNRMDPPTSQMAPNMMDRVEILKGPHALRYGNSFGGTINFISTEARFTDENSVYGRISGGYESNGNNLRSEGLMGVSGKKTDFALYGAWAQGNDYTDGDELTQEADFVRGSFGTTLNLKLGKAQQLSLNLSRNLANDVDFAALPMDLRSDDTWMASIGHRIDFSGRALKKWNTMVHGTFVDHFMDNRLKDIDPRTVNAETTAKTKTMGARTEGQWDFKSNKLFAGADFRSENAAGERTREFLTGPNAGNSVVDNPWQDGTINKTGIFGEYQLSGKKYQFVFSTRFEFNSSSIADAQNEFTAIYPENSTNQLNPSFSAGLIRPFNHYLTLGMWLGRSQRSGSLTERFINYFTVGQDPYEVLGNPLLNPEQNNQLDVTLSFKQKHTSISVDVYMAYLQNYIIGVIDTTLTPRMPSSPGVRKYTNRGEAFKTGFELAWNQQWFKYLHHQFTAAYTYGNDLWLDEPLPEIAPFDLRYMLYSNLFKNRLRPQITFRYVSEQNRVSIDYGEKASPAFTLVDFDFSYQLLKSSTLAVGVKNIFNQAYYEHLTRSVPGTNPTPIYNPGRSYFVTFTLNFM